MKKKNKNISGFPDFIRKQGIIGLAVGFLLGGAVSKVVSALVEDIINPLLGIILGKVGSLSVAVFKVGSTEILWGHFVSITIDFLIIALVVYWGFKFLKLDHLDKEK